MQKKVSGTAYFSLGSNLGDRQSNLQQAMEKIGESVGKLIAVSSLIETEPWGFQSENSFLNQVIVVETTHTPLQALKITQRIEKEIGRTKKSDKYYQDRLIDIDLILFDDLIIESEELTLPHPHFHKRNFVLEPLCEIAPELRHPVLGITVRELLSQLR